MMYLSNIPNAVLVALIAAFFLLASGQALHALFMATRKGPMQLSAAAITYEMLLAGHLTLACCTACEASINHGAMLIRLRSLTVAIEPLLWASLGIVCLGAALAIAHRKPSMIPEVTLLALCTPPVIDALGQKAAYLLIIDAAFFLFRTTTSLALDLRHLASSVTKLSMIDAIDKLPEDIMWINEKHRILYMNDAMRSRLTALGFATDLSETGQLWAELERIARIQGAPLTCNEVRIELPTGQTMLFRRDAVKLRSTACRRLMAIDVTEEESINADIQRTNSLLEAANEELRDSLDRIQEVAKNEAIVAMKARIHDTIGQRLSILHRFLEAPNPSPEALAEVTRLARGIIDDLDDAADPDSTSQLEAIVQAFALSDVAVNVQGTLPEASKEADALVHIVREAATNAVKHAQARRIDVRLFAGDQAVAMTVTNDGTGTAHVITPGSGIPGMRQAAQHAGLEFRVAALNPFTLEITRPRAIGNKEPQKAPAERNDHD